MNIISKIAGYICQANILYDKQNSAISLLIVLVLALPVLLIRSYNPYISGFGMMWPVAIVLLRYLYLTGFWGQYK